MSPSPPATRFGKLPKVQLATPGSEDTELTEQQLEGDVA